VEGLFLQLDPHSLLAQFARTQVNLKGCEAQDFTAFRLHCNLSYSIFA